MIITVETLQKMFSFDVTQKYLSKAPEVTNHNFRILLQSFSKDFLDYYQQPGLTPEVLEIVESQPVSLLQAMVAAWAKNTGRYGATELGDDRADLSLPDQLNDLMDDTDYLD